MMKHSNKEKSKTMVIVSYRRDCNLDNKNAYCDKDLFSFCVILYFG